MPRTVAEYSSQSKRPIKSAVILAGDAGVQRSYPERGRQIRSVRTSATVRLVQPQEPVAWPNTGLPNSKSPTYAAQITAEVIALCLVLALIPSFLAILRHWTRGAQSPKQAIAGALPTPSK